MRGPWTRSRPRAVSLRAGRRAVRAVVLIGAGVLLAVPACTRTPPQPPPPEVIGTSRGTVTGMEDVSSFLPDLPRTFTDVEDYARWSEDALGEGAELESSVDLTEVDLGSAVLVVDVFDACDAAHRFVAGEPGEVVSSTYDPTPDEVRTCYQPVHTLVVSEVGVEEVGADAPGSVRVR